MKRTIMVNGKPKISMWILDKGRREKATVRDIGSRYGWKRWKKGD